jgi:hypothetical protein
MKYTYFITCTSGTSRFTMIYEALKPLDNSHFNDIISVARKAVDDARDRDTRSPVENVRESLRLMRSSGVGKLPVEITSIQPIGWPSMAMPRSVGGE